MIKLTAGDIDREIRATEEARHRKSLSPSKRVHFTPSLDKHHPINTSDSSSSNPDSSDGSFTAADGILIFYI